MDSISLVTEKDRDKIVVSGSHGGMLGKDPKTAMKHDPAFFEGRLWHSFYGFLHEAKAGLHFQQYGAFLECCVQYALDKLQELG